MSKCKECGKELQEGFEANCIKCKAVLCDTCSLNNKYHCTECKPKEEHKTEFVRRSHIELYKTCPYAYYLEVVKKVPTENNIYADVGIFLHNIFDHHSNNLDEANEDMYNKFKNWYDDLEEEKFMNKEGLRDKLYQLGINNINNYINQENMMPNAFITEKTIFYSIDNNLPKNTHYS